MPPADIKSETNKNLSDGNTPTIPSTAPDIVKPDENKGFCKILLIISKKK